MTVKELIDKLQKIDPKALVVLSQDAEGNSFRTVVCVEPCFYDKGRRQIEITENKDTKTAVCFWP